MTNEQIENSFRNHPPSGNQPERYQAIRVHAAIFARLIESHCPDSREKSLAMTNLEQAVMWAKKSIAVNENPVPDEANGGQKVDYRALLKKYIELVGDCEGVTFIDRAARHGFTAEEISALEAEV